MISMEFDAPGKPERASKLRSIAIQAAGLLHRGNRLQGPRQTCLAALSHYGNRRRLIFRPSPESQIRDAIWFQANLWQPANYMPLPVMPRRTNSRIQIAGRSSSRERRLASRWPIRLRKKPSRPRCSPASTTWSNEPFAARQLTVPPGVGRLVSLTYRATVDIPARFRKSKSVGAVFGLTCARAISQPPERPDSYRRRRWS